MSIYRCVVLVFTSDFRGESHALPSMPFLGALGPSRMESWPIGIYHAQGGERYACYTHPQCLETSMNSMTASASSMEASGTAHLFKGRMGAGASMPAHLVCPFSLIWVGWASWGNGGADIPPSLGSPRNLGVFTTFACLSLFHLLSFLHYSSADLWPSDFLLSSNVDLKNVELSFSSN